MTPSILRTLILPTMLLGAAIRLGAATEPHDSLADEFRTPPDTAKPLTWWHWVDGNVTRDGTAPATRIGQGRVFNGIAFELIPLTAHADSGVRYFSGTATYRTTFEHTAPATGRVLLDLGDVQVMAEIVVNGRNLGVLWKPPFRIDIAGALNAGRNDLGLRVTNLWPNRLIGDEDFPDDVTWMKQQPYPAQWPAWLTGNTTRNSPRITFTSRRTYQKGDPLAQSGLLGPVRLIPESRIDLPTGPSTP